MIETARTRGGCLPSAQARDYAASLVRLLATRADSIARCRIYRDDAAVEQRRDYREVFDRIEAADRRHLDWIRNELLRCTRGRS